MWATRNAMPKATRETAHDVRKTSCLGRTDLPLQTVAQRSQVYARVPRGSASRYYAAGDAASACEHLQEARVDAGMAR